MIGIITIKLFFLVASGVFLVNFIYIFYALFSKTFNQGRNLMRVVGITALFFMVMAFIVFLCMLYILWNYINN